MGADQGYANDGNASNKLVAFIKSRLDVSNFFSALKDPLSYVNAALLFIVNVGCESELNLPFFHCIEMLIDCFVVIDASIPVYLPTILQGMGYTS